MIGMFKEKNILVIGDVMLDVYYKGNIDRISPEAPVPVLRKNSEKCVLGGAANVAANLSAANQNVAVMALIGDDTNGKLIKELFAEVNVDSSLINVWSQPTITKIRFLAANNQQVLRMDIEEKNAISDDLVCKMLSDFENKVIQYDVILLSDYMKGLLTYNLVQGIINISKLYGKKVFIDVKDQEFQKYKGAYLLKPNKKELHELTKMPVDTEADVIAASAYLRSEAECDYILTTCGADGMIIVGDNIVKKMDTIGKAVFDVTGAGDTTIAYLTAAVANNIDILDAMKIANFAAGIQVGKVGTSLVYVHEVEDAMQNMNDKKQKKVYRMNDRFSIMNLLTQWRDKGETIVTTNGCFDIVHRGHISLLERAKKYGDHLIVLINTDDSVKRLKGEKRPINSEDDRAAVIAAIDCVDAVILFDPLIDNAELQKEDYNNLAPELLKTAHEAPMGVLKLISPDVHIKGGDYALEEVPEAIFAKKFYSVPYIQGYSTTQIINKSKS